MPRLTFLFLAACSAPAPHPFDGARAGEEREIAGVKFRWCPAGTFVMGSPATEPERRPGEDQVEVTLTRGFWIGQYEVTQADWKRVMGEFPGKRTAGAGDEFPVYDVTFEECREFCHRLTKLARLPAGWAVRLPTEAQWEYACRAGTTTATAFGDSLSRSQANFQGQGAVPVGSYPANGWGIHDMHGNVFEWCRDWSHSWLPGGRDPDLSERPARSRRRRGGCWADNAAWPCRSAFRLQFEPWRRSDHIGFRVVVSRF